MGWGGRGDGGALVWLIRPVPPGAGRRRPPIPQRIRDARDAVRRGDGLGRRRI